jgi:O-antigen ligase
MHRITGPLVSPFAIVHRGDVQRWLWLSALIGGLAGLFWLRSVTTPPVVIATQPTFVATSPLPSGVVASMDSSGFRYSPGWRVDQHGADPSEPAAPWQEPAGTVEFEFVGDSLWLLLVVGDYWGYLYVTIDGEPANRLPILSGNVNSQGQLASYKTFYAPEQQTPTGPSEQWLQVYQSASAPQQLHRARIEVWRSWGQTPLRGVAVQEAKPLSLPRWPGFLLLVIAFWSVGLALLRPFAALTGVKERLPRILDRLKLEESALPLAVVGLLVLATGVTLNQWLLTLLGLGLLGLASLFRPTLWIAALLFGLPFYYHFPLPILPGRSLSLIDIGILGGLGLMAVQWVAGSGKIERQGDRETGRQGDKGQGASFASLKDKRGRGQSTTMPHALRITHYAILWTLISWSFISMLEADHFTVALREWRVVFFSAGLFAILLRWSLQSTAKLITDHWFLIYAWIAGGTVVALVAIWQYTTGDDVITAEGVWRVRAFYGSPNNLALYLDRTLAVSLALALFAPTVRERLLWSAPTVAQGLALFLTFSKGALLLGLPALLATLWLGGLVVLAQQGRSRRPLWWIAGVAILVGLAVLPFLGTERFQRLLDFSQGTGFLRLNLWRSAWQMALDHPLLGVGPDNFLYAYRSSYILPAAWQEPNLNHPHNWVLDWWTRLGLPGLALAVSFFALLLVRLWRGLRQFDQPALHLGLLAATLAALAHGMIDASYALPDLMIVWVLFAYLPVRLEI